MRARFLTSFLAVAAALALAQACGSGKKPTEVSVEDAATGTGDAAPSAGDGGPDAGWFGTPGPWPTDAVTIFAAGQKGLDTAQIIDVSTDEAQNIWAVSHGALYLLRPGDSAFRKYGQADGLHLNTAEPPGITAVAGGAANEVFVGYKGADIEPDEVQTHPARFRGKLDRVLLQPDGTLKVTFYNIHNNDAVGVDPDGEFIRLPDGGIDPYYTDWSYNEDRTVMRFLYDHLYHPGTLYVGYNHAVGRIDPGRPDPVHGLEFADHVHPVVKGTCGGRPCDRMGEWRALALDPSPRMERVPPVTGTLRPTTGMLWMGGRWTGGAITWTPTLFGWTNNNYDNLADYPKHPFWLAFSGPPIFPGASDGDDVFIHGIAALSDGTVYFASGPGNSGFAPRGIALWRQGEPTMVLSPTADLGLPSSSILDMQRLPDDTVLVAVPQGLWRWNPSPRPRGVNLGQVPGLPSNSINRIYVDATVKPAAVYVATQSGFALLRFP